MNQPKHLYLVFSSTKCAIGSFIRFMTHNFYNHVSVSLDPNLERLYSFARRYRRFPFYGGFVSESCLRFVNGTAANIKVCEIELSDAQYEQARALFEQMNSEQSRYIYNTLSAIASAMHRKVNIKDAYTCVEFAVKLLFELGVEGIDCNRFYTIKQVEAVFDGCVIYEGVFSLPSENSDWGNDTYNCRASLLNGTKKTLSAHLELLQRISNRST